MALRLLLGYGSHDSGDYRTSDLQEFVRERNISIADVQVAVAGGAIAWAILPIVSPGHTALLLGAGQRPVELSSAELGKLVDAACARCAQRGVHLVQVLLDSTDANGLVLFQSRDFRRMAELLYLQTSIRASRTNASLPPGWQRESYSAKTHDEFADVILASYRDSHDCPGLNGLRDIEDVIAGHQASGEFDPRYWFLFRDEQAPVGVLLLNGVPRGDIAELVYLGVVPRARGTGTGTVLFRQAVAAASQMNARRLTLAVDSQNVPALRLYYKHGMEMAGSKLALLRDLRDG